MCHGVDILCHGVDGMVWGDCGRSCWGRGAEKVWWCPGFLLGRVRGGKKVDSVSVVLGCSLVWCGLGSVFVRLVIVVLGGRVWVFWSEDVMCYEQVSDC